jgi:hypothetical protein
MLDMSGRRVIFGEVCRKGRGLEDKKGIASYSRYLFLLVDIIWTNQNSPFLYSSIYSP